MKKVFIIIFIAILFSPQAKPQINFNDYFIDKTLRIDYYHIGDARSEFITLDQLYQYGTWAGNQKNLIDNFNNGKYYCKVYDAGSNKLIFSKGYDTYFGEYRTTTPAINGVKRSYSETILVPFPKNKIKFVIESRTKEQELVPLFQTEITPSDDKIISKNVVDKNVRVYKSFIGGDPHDKVDVVILGEGYDSNEDLKFLEDMKKFTEIFFEQEPYKTYKDRFNIYGIYKPSEESGTDNPNAGIYKRTVLSTTFNSLGSDRYLLTEDNKAVRDLAAHAPYDAIYIMVNTDKYGGGGIYNLFCTFTTDNVWHEYVFLHEFGHCFAGLGDEYYTSDVSYNDFYPKGIEPTEPNITALPDKNNLKWKEFITPGIELPTLWEKKEYENIDKDWLKERAPLIKKISSLIAMNADKDSIKAAEKEYQVKEQKHVGILDNFFKRSTYWGKVGAFEGAGYSSQGLYRPMIDCIMFSKGTKPYCKVCEGAIIKMIKFYTE
jgi:hypothetical protein